MSKIIKTTTGEASFVIEEQFEDETKAIKRADYYTKKFQHEKGDLKFIVVNVFEGE